MGISTENSGVIYSLSPHWIRIRKYCYAIGNECCLDLLFLEQKCFTRFRQTIQAVEQWWVFGSKFSRLSAACTIPHVHLILSVYRSIDKKWVPASICMPTLVFVAFFVLNDYWSLSLFVRCRLIFSVLPSRSQTFALERPAEIITDIVYLCILLHETARTFTAKDSY